MSHFLNAPAEGFSVRGLQSAQLTEEHKVCLETQPVTLHQLQLRSTRQAQFKSAKIDCGSPARHLSGSAFSFLFFFVAFVRSRLLPVEVLCLQMI